MGIILTDTSALFALKNTADSFHTQSIDVFQKIGNSGEYDLLITNFILCEFLNLMNMRKNHKFAIECLDFIRQSQVFQVGPITPEIEKDSMDIFKKNANIPCSYTDCTSFAFMKHHKIKKAFTYDRHFQQMGFELVK